VNPPFSPILKISGWLDEARLSADLEPDAMALATVGPDGRPSVRIVLCRGLDARGIRFFTNYDSRKGHELAANPEAAVVFLWPSLNRQLRIEGAIEKLTPAESDAYFHARPRGHQISGFVSPQSQPIASLDVLRVKSAEAVAEFEGTEVPRPDHWGGYLLRPRAVEFWTRGDDRLHDRQRCELVGGTWREARLAP
jgi:pyridoxamine 5'-phosphate oxidase